jgi:hypothetical protein
VTSLFSLPVLALVATALLDALLLHGLLRGAEHLERHGRLFSRDALVVPGLLLIVVLTGLAADPLGRLAGVAPLDLAVAGIIGLKIGSLVPRPRRRGGGRSSLR